MRLLPLLILFAHPSSNFVLPRQAEQLPQGLEFSSPSIPISVDVAAEKSVVLSEDLAMTNAVYFAPTSLRNMLSEAFLLSPDEVEYRMANSQEWEGFGQVKIAEQ